MDLPDVNVWLALTDPRHAHHPVARRYWEEQRDDAIAFCRTTMLGLLRLATHSAVMQGEPFTPDQIWDIYRTYRAMPIIHFLTESPEIDNVFSNLTSDPEFPQRLWTDAYIAALALSSGSRIITFDNDFSRFPQLNVLMLHPVSNPT